VLTDCAADLKSLAPSPGASDAEAAVEWVTKALAERLGEGVPTRPATQEAHRPVCEAEDEARLVPTPGEESRRDRVRIA